MVFRLLRDATFGAVFVLSLRERLCTHETFIVDQILRDFLRNYH